MEQVLLLLVNFDADEVRPVALDAKAEAETIAKHVNIEEPNAALVALDAEVLRHYGDDRALPYGATEPAKAESPRHSRHRRVAAGKRDGIHAGFRYPDPAGRGGRGRLTED